MMYLMSYCTPPHENADGSEPFGKQWNEVPFFARIIHMCDTIDIFCRSMKSASDEWKRTEEFAYALDVCENECLKLCMNLAFAGSLRIGEMLGLTWDCVDISEAAIRENRAYLYVNKEV